MAIVCNVSSITSRLQDWGLNDIKVQWMGGKISLISFEDDGLYIMLEDLDWSYLKEIFCKVERWMESEKVSGEDKIEKEPGWVSVNGLVPKDLSCADISLVGFEEPTNNINRVGWVEVVSEITKVRVPSMDGARL
ncbi:hypothetical protein V6N13_074735 [Hibiscus sabdariffa]